MEINKDMKTLEFKNILIINILYIFISFNHAI